MKQHWVKAAIAGVMLAGSASTMAEFSGSVALTSDYIFDGQTQTRNEPAFQLGVDYGLESGFYLGAWFSNVDYGASADSDIETDWYAGFSFGNDIISWDFGAVQYIYLNNSLGQSDNEGDYNEIYAGMTLVENFTLKAWYALDYLKSGFESYRLKATYAYPINDTWSVPLEYTYTDYEPGFGADKYNHYKVGLAAEFKPIKVEVAYHKTDIDPGTNDPDLVTADGLFVGTVTFSF